MDFEMTDNSKKFIDEMKLKKNLALKMIGAAAEGHAKMNLTKFPRVDTGRLRASVSNKVVGNDVYIGTNVKYAPYVEFGTGKYASNGKGRPTPWFYTDDKGVTHRTEGMKPSHFLRKAATEHSKEYEKIADTVMKAP